MPTATGLADLLSGAAGAPVNRPALNAFVANSQARNGLVSAQTEDAMIKAQQGIETQAAHDKVGEQLTALYPDMKPSEVALSKSALIGALGGNPETAVKALALMKVGNGDPQQQVSGQAQYEGKIPGPVAVPNNFVMPVPPAGGSALGPVQQSPEGVAQTAAQTALANLNAHRDSNPADFRASPFGAVSPEGTTALHNAIGEGRLDPMRVNSRTAPIFAQMELASPGTNFNRLHADATLQANSTYQQRAMSVDMLPGILSNVTSLGKKLNGGAGYNDLKTIGYMQKWLNGETNDPDYTEYMAARNDAMLRLASVMRGVGMSDQAHTAELEAGNPTLAPAALDAWLKGQMSVVKPLLERQNRITHLGEKGQGTAPLAPTAGSSPPIGSYADEAAALAAGHKPGDRVIIGGVTGTLE